MKHKTRLLVIVLLGTALSFFTMSCLKESGEKVDLNLGGMGEQCKEDKSCNEGLLCDDTNICVKCIKDEDCGEGPAKCSAGHCVATLPMSECEKDADCKEGYECSAGECVGITHLDPAECATNSDCANDKYCNDGVCENRCPEGMAFIPKGSFEMGSIDLIDSSPVHKVTLNKDFCMDKYEFTNGDKKALQADYPTLDAQEYPCEDGACQLKYQWDDLDTTYETFDGQESFYDDDKPIVGVNWYMARRICQLQDKRLPTEAEWEYSASGGKGDSVCKFGTEKCAVPTDENVCANLGDSNVNSTCAVGKYGANEYGLFDMSGNVWEWVMDWMGPYTEGELTNPVNLDNNSGVYRVFRGGGWDHIDFIGLRVIARGYHTPRFTRNFVGFRCVKDLK